MLLKGTIFNVSAIVVGGLLGRIFQRIPEQLQRTILAAMALSAFVVGLSMTLKTQNFLILMSSLTFGGALGEGLRIEEGLKRLSAFIERRFKRGRAQEDRFTAAFMVTTLMFCTGPLNLLGSIDAGIRHDYNLLYTKSMFDGMSSFIFTVTLGIGAMFSALPLFFVQTALILVSAKLKAQLSESLVTLIAAQITSIGGALIMAIGLNLLELTKIRVANLLPALPIAVLLDLLT